MKKIYLDYAAATPVHTKARKAMESYQSELFGNPRSVHSAGILAADTLTQSRKTISESLGIKQSELVFTSCGTESNNLAIFGTVAALKKEFPNIKTPHIIVSAIEHSSILEPVRILSEQGVRVSIIPASVDGVLSAEVIRNELCEETVLVSIMYVNNEIGTIQPIHAIGKHIKKYRDERKTSYPYFHTDASQAARFVSVLPHALYVDLMTLDGQKIYGPKGIGALYIRHGISVEPMLYGGGQEGGLRSGTENIPGVVGFSNAFGIITRKMHEENKRLKKLKEFFIEEITKRYPDVTVFGRELDTVSGIVNIAFPGVSGEKLVIALDARGVYVSTASACSTNQSEVSHVVSSLNGVHKDRAKETVRFSFGMETTKKDLEHVLTILFEILKGGGILLRV